MPISLKVTDVFYSTLNVEYNVTPNSSSDKIIYAGTSTHKIALKAPYRFGEIGYLNDSIDVSLCFNWTGSGVLAPRIWLYNNKTKEQLSFLYSDQIQTLIDNSIGKAINNSY